MVALLCATSSARAEWDFQLATMMSGGWLRETPDLTANKVSTTARDIRKGTLASRGGLGMIGFGGDAELTIDDRWRLPLIGGNLWWAIGSYDATRTTFDGSIASVHPWTAFRGDILLPGVGRRWKMRRNMLGFAIRTGVSWIHVKADVAAGADTTALDTTQAVTFLVQAEIEACRRLDPTTRVCLQIAPRVYEHSLLNGASIGLRMEWGQ